MPEFVVEESKSLEDGKYEGTISKIEYREEPYKYTDMFIKEKVSEIELKHGCPTRVSEKSKLGKLLAQFTEIKVGNKIDPEKVLVGKEVTFTTVTEKGKDGNDYARIVDGSVKPTAKTEEVKEAA